jgi:gamma-glutamylcysteine synthetase
MKSSSKYHSKNPFLQGSIRQKLSPQISVAENKKNKFIQPPEFDTDGTTRIHVVFSTDCSDYQHWQSYALFYSAMKIGQSGKVTRIASGCSDTQAKEVIQWHKEHIQIPMSDKFSLHLTPDFKSVKTEDGKSTGKYDYFNRSYC